MKFQDVPSLVAILNDLLTDYQNQVDNEGNLIDVSKGSFTYIDTKVLASALQSLYYALKYTENQGLPNLGGTTEATLKKWASLFQITLTEGETNSELLTKLMSRIQYPPAGGTLQDWIRWAGSVSVTRSNFGSLPFTERVKFANIVESYLIPKSGTIHIAVCSQLGEIDTDNNQIPRYYSGDTYKTGDVVYEESKRLLREYKDDVGGFDYKYASSHLVAEVINYCESVRPFGISDNYYDKAGIKYQNFEIHIPSTFTNTAELETALINLVDSFDIGEIFYQSEIVTLLYNYGIKTSNIVTPSGDITPLAVEKIYADTVQVINDL